MVKYYYIDEISKQQRGPVLLTDLSAVNIRPETMVWRSGMPDWVRADSLEELAYLFDSKKPAPQQEDIRRSLPSSGNSRTAYSGHNNQSTIRDNKEERQPIPKNWLLESILLSILCCSPVSVVGIYNASKVESLYNAKDYDGAIRSSTNARNWALAGILFIPVCYTLFFLLVRITALIS